MTYQFPLTPFDSAAAAVVWGMRNAVGPFVAAVYLTSADYWPRVQAEILIDNGRTRTDIY